MAIAAATAIIYFYLTVMNVYEMRLDVFFQMNGFWYSFISVISIFAVSILFGISVAMICYNYKCMKKFTKATGSTGIGVAVATIATGCPTCGVAALSLIGMPLGLMALPLEGIELKIASIILLLISLYYLSKSIESPRCKAKV